MRVKTKKQAVIRTIYNNYNLWEDSKDDAIETECKINTNTREVFDIISVEADVDVFERQYVVIDGQEYDVVCVDESGEVGEREYWFR